VSAITTAAAIEIVTVRMVLPRHRFYGRILSPTQAATPLAANLTRSE